MPDKKNIPETIINIISAEETSSIITDICLKNGIKNEETIQMIAYQVGLVLSGGLNSNLLSDSLEKKVGLNTETTNNITKEINQSIFSQVKEELSDLYQTEPIPKEPKIKTELPQPKKVEIPKPIIKKEAEIEINKPIKKDTYREPIE